MKRKYSTRTYLILGLISAVLISGGLVLSYCQGTLLETWGSVKVTVFTIILLQGAMNLRRSREQRVKKAQK